MRERGLFLLITKKTRDFYLSRTKPYTVQGILTDESPWSKEPPRGISQSLLPRKKTGLDLRASKMYI